MEFLIIAAIIIAGGYFGYQYYLAKKSMPEAYTIPSTVDTNPSFTDEKVIEVDTMVEFADVEESIPEKKTTKKATTKTAPSKKKPTMKIVK